LDTGRSPIRRVGVKPGDVFISINDQEIDLVRTLEDELENSRDRIEFAIRGENGVIECAIEGRRSSCRR